MRTFLIAAAAGLLLSGWGLFVSGSADFYRDRPALERPIPAQAVPRGLRTLAAAECGTCHTEIYREWQQSVHAQAWSDPQFQAELHKEAAIGWLCVNCHTPLVNQIDSLVVRLEGGDVARPVRRANAKFDAALRAEGITCASCHVRDGAVEGPYGNTAAPHAVRLNPALRTTEACESCHQGEMVYPGKSFVCVFHTGDEWRAGPAAEQGRICQDCHMPAVERPLVPGGMVRTTRRHAWIGSGLPKGGEPDPALWDSLAALLPPGVELRPGEVPARTRGARWDVAAVNAHAGHRLPTGDPERAVIVTLLALDARGDTLARASRRIAQTWVWHPEARKVADDRLAPGDSAVVTLRFDPPRGPFRLIATAVNERMSDANAAFHALEGYPLRREVARVERRVP